MKQIKTVFYYFIIFNSIFFKSAFSNGFNVSKNLQEKSTNRNTQKIVGNQEIFNLYLELNLENKINYTTFYSAIKGFNKISKKKDSVITIVDFSKPSLEERGYVIDLKNKKIIYSTYVMHGKNSGDNITDDFSNILNSYKSSPGFYITENTYFGQFGYSLVLNGIEKGINDMAKERKIIMHGSKYAKPIEGAPMLSKSLGCPAVPIELAKPIIDKIKNGSVFYIHTNLQSYTSKSKLI